MEKATKCAERSIMDALDVARGLVAAVGQERIELVTLTPTRITLHPTNLDDGESVARSLGFDEPMDHRMIVPGYTLWTGIRQGLECQVRSVLRGTTVSNR